MLDEFEDRDLVLTGDERVEFSLDFFLDFRLGLTGESDDDDVGLSGDESGKPRNGERARDRDREVREVRWSLEP